MAEDKTRSPAKTFYTIAELMERWQVSRSTIWRQVKGGRLMRTYVGGSVRFAVEDVRRYELTSR